MKEANESITKGEHQLHPPPWARDLACINRQNGFDLLKIEVGTLLGYRSCMLDFFSKLNSTTVGERAPWRYTELKEDPHKALSILANAMRHTSKDGTMEILLQL